MFLRPLYRRRNGQREAYWALVESYRTKRGPRQRTVAYLGLMDEAGRLGVEQAADPQPPALQGELFPQATIEPRYVEVDRTRMRVENCRQFGAAWLALELVKQLGLHEFFERTLPSGQEHVPWSLTALILVIARLCEPSSELHIAEHFYRQSGLCDLLGVPVDKVDDIEEGLAKIAAGCLKRAQPVGQIERRVGRLLGQNTRAAGLFDIQITAAAQGGAQLVWKKVETWRAWAQLSEGSYVLRSNVSGWSDEDLWRAYIQLTDAETAFRIQKSDLSLRPVWHQKEDRVLAHILVCFLAFVLWKFLGQLCQRAGLGDEPRRVLTELSELRVVDVVLPTKDGHEIRTRCVTQPSPHQKILLQRLGLKLPGRLRPTEL